MGIKQTRFYLYLILLIIAGVAILGGGGLLWSMQSSKISRLDNEYKGLVQENEALGIELQRKSAEDEKLKSLNAVLRELDSNLADYRYVPTYLRQMQKAALETGNDIMSIRLDTVRPLDPNAGPLKSEEQGKDNGNASPAPKPAPATASNIWQVQSIPLDIQGTYPSVVRFLERLSRFPKLIYVRSINLSPIDGKDGSIRVTARLETYAVIAPSQYKKPEDVGETDTVIHGGAQ